MKQVVGLALLLVIAACSPPYVWGDADRVEQRLMEMVPIGSPLSALAATAEERGWDIDRRNFRSWPAGSKTYMDDTHLRCRSAGGPAVPIVVARYSAPFMTVVETLWLFDQKRRLRDVCVRKTVDAL
jgi:hypothetical protein